METTKPFRRLWHDIHRKSVRSGVIHPGEEKVSRDPFSIFRGLMGDYREDGAKIFSEGQEKRMRGNRCTAARGNSD